MKTRYEIWAEKGIVILLCVFALLCLIPFWLVVAGSFTDESVIIRKGYQLWPEKFSLEAYRYVFANKNNPVFQAYLVTIFVTVTGTFLGVMITSMAAFTLSNPKVEYRDQLTLFFFIPMIFGGGLVPWYLMCNRLGLVDNIWALIIPSVFSGFNAFLVRNYMRELPNELRDSALVDGARDFTILFRIYLPLCKPVIATITLFIALGYWNDWFNAIMLVTDDDLYPLQYLLFKIQSDLSALKTLQNMGVTDRIQLPGESLKMATAFITVGPVILLYPFLQKYFVKGLIVGAVKG